MKGEGKGLRIAGGCGFFDKHKGGIGADGRSAVAQRARNLPEPLTGERVELWADGGVAFGDIASA